MRTVFLHRKETIEAFLRRNTFLHIYAIGDLDDFFWPDTTWYALQEGDQIGQVALLYAGTPLPVLLAFAEYPADTMRELLRSILRLLPRAFYAHLSPGLVDILAEAYELQTRSPHIKMGLTDPSRLEEVDTSDVTPLSAADLPELQALYSTSYPGHWFDPRMLGTGLCYGMRRGGDLVSAAGIHVYSPTYRAAALGNVTTHPAYRGRGLATAVCARLCQSLLQAVDYIGLNVQADNQSAIACYRKLGFSRIAAYEECSFGSRLGS